MSEQWRWANAHEWLMEKIDDEYKSGQDYSLLVRLQAIIPRIDDDTIQELFEGDMDFDGYFERINQ